MCPDCGCGKLEPRVMKDGGTQYDWMECPVCGHQSEWVQSVIITPERCSKCGHLVSDHDDDGDRVYCLGNMRDNSTQLPFDYAPVCPCTRRF